MTTETGQLTTPAPERGRGGPSRLESFIDTMIDMGQTGQIFGEHGIGKTATFFSHIGRAHPGTALVYVPAANLTPDDLLVNAPVRDPETGELVLRQLVMNQLKPGTPFVLLIDDSLQAGDTIQSQLMQIACNWTLGEHDLRALGCVGVFLTDNESLSETSARRGDLALLDRMVTMRITANDTSWRRHLAAKYRPWDLSSVFSVWASLSPALRELLSPRTLDHVLANAKEGFPLRWGLPLIDGERLRLAEPGPDGKPGQNRTAEILDRLAQALGVPNPATVPDPVRQVVRAALRNRWTVLLQGPPGCGKTELVRETVRAGLGREPLYFSLPVTNVEDLCAPIPSAAPWTTCWPRTSPGRMPRRSYGTSTTAPRTRQRSPNSWRSPRSGRSPGGGSRTCGHRSPSRTRRTIWAASCWSRGTTSRRRPGSRPR
jgi:hypothetical protein